jgi:hypothetical protein
MRADVGLVVGAVAPVAAGEIVLVASPDAWVKLLLANPILPFPVLPSGALAAKTVVAIAANALAAAVDPVPKITASSQTTLHMEDTAPLPISTISTAVAAPTRSLFQTDSMAIRLILDVNWGLRATGAVAWLTATNW